MAKRLFDILAAAGGLVVVTPLLLILGIVIKLNTAGPVFYRSTRVGKDGVLFPMLKLRTMVVDADRIGSALTHSDDPRITRVGRFLRHYKLDELPQLINVLRGQMSIVGPRPESPCYVERFSPEQRRILRVRPGITGQAQIAFRNEEALLSELQTCDDLEEAYLRTVLPRKIALDMDYVAHHSLLRDLRLILETVAIVLRKEQSREIPVLAELGR